MKLATLKDGSRDGLLAVVSRDLKTASIADGIAPTLQRALDDWNFIAPQLEELYGQLNQGRAKRSFEFNPAQCMAPLPRAYQWADGSVYVTHMQRMAAAAGIKAEDISWREPMLYQGGSDDFIGGADDVVFAEESWGIDFEAEIGVILGDTPMQVKRDEALEHVRLITLINDWSLRNLIAREIAKHFGFFQSKPATAFAPIAVTPDELGEAWKEGLAHVNVNIAWNGVRFGQLNAAEGAKFGFAELIAHAAKTRNLRAGTVLGLGTISNAGGENGFATITEKRAQEAAERNAEKAATKAAAKAAAKADKAEKASRPDDEAEAEAKADEIETEAGTMEKAAGENVEESAVEAVAETAVETIDAKADAGKEAADIKLTEFMKFGDRVRIEVKDAGGVSVFGAIDQQVISLRRRRAAQLAEAQAAADARAAAEAGAKAEPTGEETGETAAQ